MVILKKLIFAPISLIIFGLLIYSLAPIVKSYDFIFSLSINTLINLIAISFLLTLSSLLFVLFASLAEDFKIVLPVSSLLALISMLFLDLALGLVFAVAIFVSLLLTYLSLDHALKSYINFQPEALLGPSIRRLLRLFILSFCLVYFLSINKVIAQNGFQIPDSLIDTVLKMTPQPEAPSDLMNNLIKQTVNDQVQNLIKPYLSFIPAILALLLFFTLQSLTSILNLLIFPLLWIIFFILEKSGFIKFEIEMRLVKKMVV